MKNMFIWGPTLDLLLDNIQQKFIFNKKDRKGKRGQEEMKKKGRGDKNLLCRPLGKTGVLQPWPGGAVMATLLK